MISTEFRFKVSENAWLAFIPVVATYLAFVFQSSYFSYFGVPISMVDVDVPKIIFSMAALTVAAVLVSILFAFVADLLRSQNPVVMILGKGLLVIVFFLPFILAGLDFYSVKQQLAYAGIALIFWLINFWPPAQRPGESKSYLERLKEQEDKIIGDVKPQNIKQVVGQMVMAPFSLVFFLSMYVMMLGAYCASLFGGSTYLKENPNALYVGRTGSAYIFTIVDPKTNTFGNQVLLIDDGAKIELVHAERVAKKSPRSHKDLTGQGPISGSR